MCWGVKFKAEKFRKMSILWGAVSCTPISTVGVLRDTQSLWHPHNMKEMREHAEEIQTNTALFAGHIHTEKEGEL